MAKGWFFESWRHRLARLGIPTKSMSISFRAKAKPKEFIGALDVWADRLDVVEGQVERTQIVDPASSTKKTRERFEKIIEEVRKHPDLKGTDIFNPDIMEDVIEHAESQPGGKPLTTIFQEVKIAPTDAGRELAREISKWSGKEMTFEEAMQDPAFVRGSVVDQLAEANKKYEGKWDIFDSNTHFAWFNIVGARKTYLARRNPDGSYYIEMVK